MLSVSSHARQNARRCIEADASSVQHAEKEALDGHHKVVDYQCHLYSGVLCPNEEQETQLFPVSSW
jgi:hypothetical protein